MFEGFERLSTQRQDEQPEVIDPKTGKPFNLTDPDFPIVKGHRFSVRYWAMPRTPQYMLKYLDEHYDYFNRTRFHGKLKKPTLTLIKAVNAADFSLRGQWRPRERKLRMSPNLFNAPHEGWVNRILIHEMAHQYVSDFEGGESEEKGHGPKWKACMVRVGLPPLRYDYEKNSTYLKKAVKEQMQRSKDNDQFMAQVLKTLKDTQGYLENIGFNRTFEYVDRFGNIRKGITLKPSGSGDRWLFTDVKTKAIKSVPPDNMFNPAK